MLIFDLWCCSSRVGRASHVQQVSLQLAHLYASPGIDWDKVCFLPAHLMRSRIQEQTSSISMPIQLLTSSPSYQGEITTQDRANITDHDIIDCNIRDHDIRSYTSESTWGCNLQNKYEELTIWRSVKRRFALQWICQTFLIFRNRSNHLCRRQACQSSSACTPFHARAHNLMLFAPALCDCGSINLTVCVLRSWMRSYHLLSTCLSSPWCPSQRQKSRHKKRGTETAVFGAFTFGCWYKRMVRGTETTVSGAFTGGYKDSGEKWARRWAVRKQFLAYFSWNLWKRDLGFLIWQSFLLGRIFPIKFIKKIWFLQWCRPGRQDDFLVRRLNPWWLVNPAKVQPNFWRLMLSQCHKKIKHFLPYKSNHSVIKINCLQCTRLAFTIVLHSRFVIYFGWLGNAT